MTQTMRLCDIIQDQAEQALAAQRSDGAMPPGWNGPNHTPETPVRMSAHWLITFAWLYRTNREQRYIDAVAELAAYLMQPDNRPNGYSFLCLNQPGRDHCNGLIGQAWVFEALAEATRTLNDDRYRAAGLEVFEQHSFDRKRGLWIRLEYDGTPLGHDMTFNHQLWFAAGAAELTGESGTEDGHPIACFMDHINENFEVRENGRVCHAIYRRVTPLFSLGTAKNVLKPYLKTIAGKIRAEALERRLSRGDILVAREPGYHAFNLYAFAMLKKIFVDHPIFRSSPFLKAVSYLQSTEYELEVHENPYGFGYNAPGFEVPYCLAELSQTPREERLRRGMVWIDRQICKTYNHENRAFSRNTEDATTLAARIYECTRFPEELLFAVLDA